MSASGRSTDEKWMHMGSTARPRRQVGWLGASLLGGLLSALPVGLFPALEYFGTPLPALLEPLRFGILGPTMLVEEFVFGGGRFAVTDGYILAALAWFAIGFVFTLFFRKAWMVIVLWAVLFIAVMMLAMMFSG